MPIVSSQIIHSIKQPQSRRQIRLQATDDVAGSKPWEKNISVPDANDDAATLAEYVIELEPQLPGFEADAEAERAQQGKQQAAQYQTQAELDKAVISLLMQIDDSLEFSQTLDWFRDFEVRAGPSANSRANYLGVTSQDYGLVADRYNQITGVKTGLENDAERVWQPGEVW